MPSIVIEVQVPNNSSPDCHLVLSLARQSVTCRGNHRQPTGVWAAQTHSQAFTTKIASDKRGYAGYITATKRRQVLTGAQSERVHILGYLARRSASMTQLRQMSDITRRSGRPGCSFRRATRRLAQLTKEQARLEEEVRQLRAAVQIWRAVAEQTAPVAEDATAPAGRN